MPRKPDKRIEQVQAASSMFGHSSMDMTKKYYLVDDVKNVEYQVLYAA